MDYLKDPRNVGKGYFTCTCPAGQEGFAHCSQGTCKHVRWALAAEQVYKAERKARNAAKAQAAKAREEDKKRYRVDGKPIDDETYDRIVSAQPHPYTEAEVKRDRKRHVPHPFRLLK